ncbi:MAG TPA: flagellar assembly protein FliX [Alphaproteobacteria bacterium]|jgi:hypothetical protein|nr:flagellar assembly protein FliX [Alphaproteobacteria bacterium]
MKVDGPNKSSGTKGPAKTGAKRGAGGASFGSMIDETDETSAKSGVSGAAPTAQIDALLALQEMEDSTSEEAARRAKKRGQLLLDQLDQLRLGLLTGGIALATLHQLERMVTSERDRVMDPKLAAVLDEIDLRVQIELAKHFRK